MNVLTCDISGLLTIEPKVFGDARGFFLESWNLRRYREAGVGAESSEKVGKREGRVVAEVRRGRPDLRLEARHLMQSEVEDLIRGHVRCRVGAQKVVVVRLSVGQAPDSNIVGCACGELPNRCGKLPVGGKDGVREDAGRFGEQGSSRGGGEVCHLVECCRKAREKLRLLTRSTSDVLDLVRGAQ